MVKNTQRLCMVHGLRYMVMMMNKQVVDCLCIQIANFKLPWSESHSPIICCWDGWMDAWRDA